MPARKSPSNEGKHVEPFRAERSELLVLVVYPVEQFLGVQELQVNLEVLGYCNCQRFTPRLRRYRMQTWSIPHEVALGF